MFVTPGSRAGRGAAVNTLYTQVLPIVIPYAATIVLDLGFGRRINFAIGTLTGNLTLKLWNGRPGQVGWIDLNQDGTGSRLLTISGTAPYHGVITAGGSPTLTPAASSKDRLYYAVKTPTTAEYSLNKAFA